MTAAPSPEPVVVGVDGLPAGWAALRQAADLARRLGVRLEVVHIVSAAETVGMVPPGLGARPVQLSTPQERVAHDESAQRLHAEVEHVLGGHGQDWSFHIRHGEPEATLSAFAEECDAYCIVIGAPGDGMKAFLDRIFRSSVSRAMIRQPDRPVLVVAPESAP